MVIIILIYFLIYLKTYKERFFITGEYSVYGLINFDFSLDVFYIGITSQGLNRIKQHKINKDFDDFIIFTSNISKEAALTIEALLINKFNTLVSSSNPYGNKINGSLKRIKKYASKLSSCEICQELDCILSEEEILKWKNFNYKHYFLKQRGFENLTKYKEYLIKERGFKNWTKYYDHLAKEKGFENNSKYQEYLIKERGFENHTEYREHLAKERGFESNYKYQNHLAKKKGFESSSQRNFYNNFKGTLNIVCGCLMSSTSNDMYKCKRAWYLRRKRPLYKKSLLEI